MNYERLAQVVAIIDANPESWKQDDWHSPCGTKHCLAEHAELLARDIPKLSCSFATWDIAQEFFEMTPHQADYFFGRNRTLSDFRFAPGEPYSASGFDSIGFDREGYTFEGLTSRGDWVRGLNESGYDRNGYDREGFDMEGYDEDGYDRKGYDVQGYDRKGRDEYDRTRAQNEEA